MAKAIWNGVTLAESDKPEIVEGNVYFPPESVKWEYFKDGETRHGTILSRRKRPNFLRQ